MKRVLVALGVFLFLGASWAAERPEGPLGLFSRGPGPTREKLLALTDEMTVAMTGIRGLKLPGPVRKKVHTPEELKAVFLAKLDKEWPVEESERWSEAYQALGLFPEGVNFRDVLARVMQEQMAGAYDSDSETMYLIQGTPAVLLPVILVHELTHAGQDANFDLDALMKPRQDNDDLSLAAMAVVEGDATAVMCDYLIGGDSSAVADLDLLMASGPSQFGSPELALAPRAVQELLMFPYVAGLGLVAEVRRRNGWPGVNELYGDLPLSSEQVMHPEKYLGKRDVPQTMTFPESSTEKVRGEFLEENVLGEFGLKLLLEEFTTSQRASVASQGWDGDRFTVWRRGTAQDKETWLIALVTTWDTERDAREFFEAYSHLITNKYRDEKALQGGGPNRRLWQSERGLIEVALRDRDVLVLEGFEKRERSSLWQMLESCKKEELTWPPARVPVAD